MAIVAEGDRGRIYLAPISEHELVAHKAVPDWKPHIQLAKNPRDFKTPNYGMDTFADLFTPRQLVSLTTFSDLVADVMERVKRDAHDDTPKDERPLRDGGTGAKAYAEAVGVYLSFAIDRMAMTGNNLVRWNSVGQKAQHCFGRQALPMLWDFAEPNFFANRNRKCKCGGVLLV